MKATVHECIWIIEGQVSRFESFPLEFDENNFLELFQKIVGGYIDIVHMDDKDIVVHDEGLLYNQPLNPWAKQNNLYLVGTIIECEGRLP